MARDKRTLELIERTKNDKGYVKISELADRYLSIDDKYKSSPWNLKQILMNMLMVPRYVESDSDQKEMEVITPFGTIQKNADIVEVELSEGFEK